MNFMFGRGRMDRELNLLMIGESLKTHPVIESAAGSLALQQTTGAFDPEQAYRISSSLAAFRDDTGYSTEIIQHALIAADPTLGECIEKQAHTY